MAARPWAVRLEPRRSRGAVPGSEVVRFSFGAPLPFAHVSRWVRQSSSGVLGWFGKARESFSVFELMSLLHQQLSRLG